jgi:cyclophilin family peptidyl-prolyl cis-trans isomerase
MNKLLKTRGFALMCAAVLLACSCSRGADEAPTKPAAGAPTKNPVVEIKTNKGTMVVELYPDKAPKTVANFLSYVDKGFYNGTIFHRVIPDFMIQGGGYTGDRQRKDTDAPVQNEANNGLKNLAGSIAMARTSDPNSATSQFFINAKDNAFLDFKNDSPQGWGYAVFGKVIEGTEVVHAIEHAPTSDQGGAFANLPQDQVTIESISVRK